jgi:hypothetical protein
MADECDEPSMTEEALGPPIPPLAGGARGGRKLVKPGDVNKVPAELTPPQRLLILDTWRRSGLPAGDFASLVGLSKHTLYSWKKKFTQDGPAGLMAQPKGDRGSRLPEVTRRSAGSLASARADSTRCVRRCSRRHLTNLSPSLAGGRDQRKGTARKRQSACGRRSIP